MNTMFKKSILLIAMLLTVHKNTFAAPIDVNTVLSSSQSWYGDTLPGYQAGTPEMKVVKFKIVPGAVTSTHIHPINGAGYIISGELTMYATSDPHGDFSDPTKTKKIVLKPGEAWNEALGREDFLVGLLGKVDFLVE